MRGQTIANRYYLLEEIGRGSFGQVFKAEDVKFKPARAVALKLFNPHFLLETELRVKIEQEAGILAQFNHRNILRVLDFEIDAKMAFIVTELASTSLDKKLSSARAQKKNLPIPQVLSYLEQLAAALDEAHLKGLVHRDIKPQNILLNEQDEILLADFGLAVLHTASYSQLVNLDKAGTPLYMAPEQWNGEIGKASDLYALAVVIFELLTGVPPFFGNQYALNYQHQYQAVPKLSDRLSSLVYPPGLDEVFARALAKQVSKRTRSARQFYTEFRACFEELSSFRETSSAYFSAATPQTTSKLEEALPDTPTLPLGHFLSNKNVTPNLNAQSTQFVQVATNYYQNQSGSRVKPRSYIRYPRDPHFKVRPGEFEKLEHLILGDGQTQAPLKLIGITGMGGIGKTQVAVEISYRFQAFFPDGIFWLTAAGKTYYDWQREFANLALHTDYLASEEDYSGAETQLRRASHFCNYLATHPKALLVLDNVEELELVTNFFPQLIGQEAQCKIIYTSKIAKCPPGTVTHNVSRLTEEASLQLILASSRPNLMLEIVRESEIEEVEAARKICRLVDSLPLALVLIRSILEEDKELPLALLHTELVERGAIDLLSDLEGLSGSLLATLKLSWEMVEDASTRSLFKLAGFFPKAAPIPLWLLGLAAGLEESDSILKPLGRAWRRLRDLSLLEKLADGQVRLHPLVQEFSQKLVREEAAKGQALLLEAGENLAKVFTDVAELDKRVRSFGYWETLGQLRTALQYAGLLNKTLESRETAPIEKLQIMERWLDKESYLLTDGELCQQLPALFYQQIYNRSIEEANQVIQFGETHPNQPWFRQTQVVGSEDKALRRILTGHANSVTSCVFSPDGKWILSGSYDTTAALWDAVNGQLLRKYQGHSSPVQGVAFAPDAKQLLTSGSDKTICLWDAESGELIRVFSPHRGAIRSVAFSPSGKSLVSGSSDQIARLWDVDTGKLIREYRGHQDTIQCVTFSPDGKWLLTGAGDKTVCIWDVITGQVFRELVGHPQGVSSVAFSPNGKNVISGGADNLILLWEVSSGKLIREFKGHENAVYSVTFSPNGKQILSGSVDSTVRLWDVSTGQTLRIYAERGRKVNSVNFSPDGRQIVSGSEDGAIRLWEVNTEYSPNFSAYHTGFIDTISFTAFGKQLLTGSSDGKVILWDTKTFAPIQNFNQHREEVTAVALTPDLIATASRDKTIGLWHKENGKLLALLRGHRDWVTGVAFSPDSSKLVSAGGDKTLKLWDIETKELLRTFYGHTKTIRVVTFSGDGKLILSGARDNTARIWEVASGKLLHELTDHSYWITSVLFSNDNTLGLTGSGDKTIRVWDVQTGDCLDTLEGHNGYIRHLALSPSGKLLISCDSNGQIRLWQIEEGKSKLIALYQATYEVRAVHWEDERNLILADKGGTRYLPYLYYVRLENF
jgi:WD40 repeat protein/serine/threonine protein kinase